MKHGYFISGFVSRIGRVSDTDTLGYAPDTHPIRSNTLLEYSVFFNVRIRFGYVRIRLDMLRMIERKDVNIVSDKCIFSEIE